jgi:uncharacterized protein (DUF305 family)
VCHAYNSTRGRLAFPTSDGQFFTPLRKEDFMIRPALLGAMVIGLSFPLYGQGPAKASGASYPGRYPWTQADADFVTGMISHHAQAVIMANMAPSHGAGRAVGVLCARIVNAQTDEIHLMQDWLKQRGLPVPPPEPLPMKMTMNGVEHEMMMPGMLTDEQMKNLTAARGTEFDRLFLTYMIQHHEGAIAMVNDVNASPGAVQDDAVFKMTSDIYADQSNEIVLMQNLLSKLPAR